MEKANDMPIGVCSLCRKCGEGWDWDLARITAGSGFGAVHEAVAFSAPQGWYRLSCSLKTALWAYLRSPWALYLSYAERRVHTT